jgi:chemotaxis-related protein WspD
MDYEAKVNKCRCWKVIGVYGDMSCHELSTYIHCRNCPKFTKAGRELFSNNHITDELLDEWTVKNSRLKDSESKGDVSIVQFRLNNEWFALATKFLLGANEVLPVHSVPHRTNSIFEGLVNINGELLCCISAYEVLGIKKQISGDIKKKGYGRMVTIAKDNDVFVFKVDELLRAKRIVSDDLKKPPATLSKSYKSFTKNIFLNEDRKVGFIDETVFFKALRESLNIG